MIRVLIVCSGNICRSPMAAVLAEKLLKEAGIEAMIISAGTLGIRGAPAAPFAIAAMEEIGLSLDMHRSQGISTLLLRAADHILVMSPEHAEAVLERDPALSSKVRRLWSYAPEGELEEIADPVGLELEHFIACRSDLEACLAAWVAELKARRG
jgi:protein-tyrosine phosphatase